MASFTKFNAFVQNLGRGAMNLNADTLAIALCNTAPIATNSLFGDLTEISAGNGYSAGGTTTGSNTFSQSSGTAKLISNDVVFTATGAVGPLRYAAYYDTTPTSPLKPLVGFWDYGSSISLANGETFTVDLDGTNGVLQLA